ncbi:uncharacterized protein LOC126665390 isoform X2 [Mercurialis annua]|uniref:uncharacterized protein LOC126665390 isoform X2 n=1 Tax=Mercurialis annua TaxID=3986 RepID=UPI00215E07FE|nr:uncharacterized protein LOC126665390 isoform X2 [Mercurialis annua]
MASSSSSPPRLTLRLLLHLSYFTLLLLLIPATHAAAPTFKGVDINNPIIDITPSILKGEQLNLDSKDILYCERVKISGHSRLLWGSYANAFRVNLAPYATIPERMHSRILVCIHQNASSALCHCEKDEWKGLQKGVWSAVMSPYNEKFVDVKFVGEIYGPVKLFIKEDLQQWRLVSLAVGFLLLLLAPIVSSWVPFYYTSSMAIGVFLVVIILLFQGMKLLPTGRKNVFYLSVYGSVLGAGTFILHHISVLANSILINFGLSEEMHNPVYVFLVAGIVLAGAALGYWIVRKFVIAKDGSVDVGVAQFVKWAMRIIAAIFIFQSTLDTLLAMVTLLSLYIACLLINKYLSCELHPQGGSLWVQQGRQVTTKHNRAEFLSRSGKMSSVEKMWGSSKSNPVKGSGLLSPSTCSATNNQQNYFSTFHKTPKRKKFTKKDWEDFTRESTQQAVREWAASPETAAWLVDNADRIQLIRSDCSSDDTIGSESDSSDETVTGNGKRFCLFNW